MPLDFGAGAGHAQVVDVRRFLGPLSHCVGSQQAIPRLTLCGRPGMSGRTHLVDEIVGAFQLQARAIGAGPSGAGFWASDIVATSFALSTRITARILPPLDWSVHDSYARKISLGPGTVIGANHG